MKTLKKTLVWFLLIFIGLNLAIILSGKIYLYKGVANTYLKGKKGASIDEYKIFHNREVKSGIHQPWPRSEEHTSELQSPE